jgi:hypothetical protein
MCTGDFEDISHLVTSSRDISCDRIFEITFSKIIVIGHFNQMEIKAILEMPATL